MNFYGIIDYKLDAVYVLIGETLTFMVIYAAVIDIQMELNLYLDETDLLSSYAITNSIHDLRQIMFVFISIVAMIVQWIIFIVLFMSFVIITIYNLNTNRNSDCQTGINNRNTNIVIVVVHYKETVSIWFGQMAHFQKIYANTEGFAVMDGSQNDGIFMKSVCRVFKDYKDIKSYKFTDFIFKIREFTKRDSTLNDNLFNLHHLLKMKGQWTDEWYGSKY